MAIFHWAKCSLNYMLLSFIYDIDDPDWPEVGVACSRPCPASDILTKKRAYWLPCVRWETSMCWLTLMLLSVHDPHWPVMRVRQVTGCISAGMQNTQPGHLDVLWTYLTSRCGRMSSARRRQGGVFASLRQYPKTTRQHLLKWPVWCPSSIKLLHQMEV